MVCVSYLDNKRLIFMGGAVSALQVFHPVENQCNLNKNPKLFFSSVKTNQTFSLFWVYK